MVRAFPFQKCRYVLITQAKGVKPFRFDSICCLFFSFLVRFSPCSVIFVVILTPPMETSTCLADRAITSPNVTREKWVIV